MQFWTKNSDAAYFSMNSVSGVLNIVSFEKFQRKSMLHHMTADLIMQFTAVNTLTWAYSLIIEDIPPTHGRSLPTSNNRIFWENFY